MKPFKRIFDSLLLAAVIAVTAVGCGKATLEQGGAYSPLPITNIDGTVSQQQPDYELFVADQSFQLAHNAIQTVMAFERDNRAMLWTVSPEIKHALDSVRPQVVNAEMRFSVARRAYIAAPAPANLTTLEGILAEIQRLSTTVQAVVPANRPAKH